MTPTTQPARRGARLPRVLAIVAVAGMVAMWGYVLYLAFGPGRADPPDRLADPAFATHAQEVCSAALDRVAALPPAFQTEDAVDRAAVLASANRELEEMLDRLERLVPSGEDGEIVRRWLADWRTYLADREAYAGALRNDPGARLLVTAKAGHQVTDYLDAFAQDNAMPACSTPTDAA